MTKYFRQATQLFLIFLPTILFSQRTDTTIVTMDNSTGVKKIIYEKYIGGGGGYGGNAPRLTKRTITKYDKDGKIVYQSHHVTRLRGCIRDTRKWDIITRDPQGSYKTLELSKHSQIIIKTFDVYGKLYSKEIFKYQIPKANWMDDDEDNSMILIE